MNKLMQLIEACMSGFVSDGQGNLSACFTFPADFLGFQGHFPGNPVLPGVCIVQAVMAMAAKSAGRPLNIASIVTAKWFVPAGPGTMLNFAVQVIPGDSGSATLKAKVKAGTQKVADLTLAVEGLTPGKGAQS